VLVQYEQEVLPDEGGDYGLKKKHVEPKPEKWFKSFLFEHSPSGEVLLCVDNEFNLVAFGFDAQNPESFRKLSSLNLFEHARLFNLVAKHVDEDTKLTLL